MQFNTPLRYPGGKGRLTQFVADLFEANEMIGGHYAEPYAGGAGIALTLLYLEYVDHIHLNDLNVAVFAFWHSVLNEGTALSDLIRTTPLTMDEWHRQRQIQRDPTSDLLSLGFSTFYLNRTNRSGILSGGVIGGKAQTGPWKLDARFNREELAQRVLKIAGFRGRISLHNLDAARFVVDELPKLPKDSLIYLDPPYYAKGKALYEHHYKHEDHAQVAQLVATISQRWIVSYDNVPQICDLYRSYDQEIFALNYSAGPRYAGTEVMVFSPGLKHPDPVVPSRRIAA